MAEVNLTDLIGSSRPRRGLSKMGILILAALGLLVLSLLVSPATNGDRAVPEFLLWAGLLTILLISTIGGAIRRQALSRWSRLASDLCLLEQWPEAIKPLQQLLAKPVPGAQIRYQGLLELAGVAEHTGQAEAAGQIYQAIAEEQPSGLLGSLALVGKAIVLLKLDQLADADNVIRRLETGTQGKGLKSLVLLARLYQQVKTGHYADALAEESDKCELARVGMSSKAAYVYALLGLAHRGYARLETKDEELPSQASQAERMWQRATMLLAAESLVEKLPELDELRNAYASAPPLPGAKELSVW